MPQCCEKFLIEFITVVAVNIDSTKILTSSAIINHNKKQLPHNDFLKEIMIPLKIIVK